MVVRGQDHLLLLLLQYLLASQFQLFYGGVNKTTMRLIKLKVEATINAYSERGMLVVDVGTPWIDINRAVTSVHPRAADKTLQRALPLR